MWLLWSGLSAVFPFQQSGKLTTSCRSAYGPQRGIALEPEESDADCVCRGP